MTLLMTIPNWNELAWYHYLALGNVVVVLALLLYFATGWRAKIPAVFMGILGGMAVGGALGAGLVIGMIALGVQRDRDYVTTRDGPPPQGGGPPGIGKGGPFGKMGGGKQDGGKQGGGKQGGGGGSGGMMGGGAGSGPSPQAQLASLVSKLDLLTHKPLAVSLNAEQKRSVRASLEKLEKETILGDNDARAKIEELRKVLDEDQRKTLEAAGYRWPAQGAAATPAPRQAPPNPFSEGENSKHLKSLLTDLK